MIKDILKERNISVYRCSKESGIPYTTLNELVLGKKNIKDCSVKTLMLLSEYLKLPIEEIVNDKKINYNIATDWEDKKNHIYEFPVIVNSDKYEVSRIHPLMQKKTSLVYEYIKDEKNVKKLVLFGSSINIRCNSKSDMDFAVELFEDDIESKNRISECISKIVDYNCDIVWINNIKDNERLMNNINKGVVVYE